jgi:hypothetical protein
MSHAIFFKGLAVHVPQPRAAVDVLPLVNLFLALVPFLLLCASFTPLAAAQIESLPPTAGTSLFILRIKPNSFVFESAKQASIWVGRPADPHDGTRRGYEQLAEACGRIKARLPHSTTLTVIPGDDVPYEDVVLTLDTLRRSHGFTDLVLGVGGAQ